MENTQNSSNNIIEDQERVIKNDDSLPRDNWYGGPLSQHDGVWYPSVTIRGVITSQKLFEAEESDIILATLPKSGTTWLKALIFSIVNRHRFKPEESPLLTTQPHDLVCGLEFEHFYEGVVDEKLLDQLSRPRIFATHAKLLDQLSRPRIFATHAPLAALPHSIKASNCRIVYVCRNPLDTFVSFWHFGLALLMNTTNSTTNGMVSNMDEMFAKYCQGVHPFGPFWDHVLEYWKMSVEKPQNVLFMRYEDLKEDIVSELKRLAMFLGLPFTVEEEEQELVEEISRLCSFGNLKSLEVNQNGVRNNRVPVSAYFRRGEVGDYANHLTPSMAETLINITEEKFAGSGLVFKSLSNFSTTTKLN